MSERTRFRAEQDRPWGARAVAGIGRFYARVFHQLDVLSPSQLPKSGPAILVCNHTSGVDPVLIQSACQRLIIWMMAKEYYDLAALRWGFRLLDVIPVVRGGRDLSATRTAFRALSAGRVLGLFPEGRIEPDRALLPFRTGAAMMAKRAKVPVFPAYLDGTQRGTEILDAFVQSHHARLDFGPQIATNLAEVDDLDVATACIQSAVEALQKLAAS